MSIRNGNRFLLIAGAALLLMCADGSAQMYSATGRVIDAVTAQPIARSRFVYGQPVNSIDNGPLKSD